MGAYADNADACVKGWVNLGSVDPDANTVSVAAVGSDGYDPRVHAGRQRGHPLRRLPEAVPRPA